MTRLLDSRWFGLADLICAMLGAMVIYGWPGLGGWPLLITLLPWAVRPAAGRFPFRRTWLDFPLALFLITAASGVWAAYDPQRAWAKFWILASAIGLYYALAGQPRENLWLSFGLASLCGAYIAGYFLLTHDWHLLPADLRLLNRLGEWWVSVRPTLSARPLYENIAGGLLALLAPFPLALALRALRPRRILMGVFALVTGGMIALGLLMTSSRAAWGALAAAVGAWLVWGLSGLLAPRLARPRRAIFLTALLIVCLPVVGFILVYPGGWVALANKLPGLPNGASRLDLARDAVRLVGDFAFTGGGLGAFSGLYSRYMLIINVFLFSYSHNFLLDVAVEQGAFGALAFAIIMLAAGGALLARLLREREPEAETSLQAWAVLAGWIALILHGLLGDALYSENGSPMLFLLTGLALVVAAPPAGSVTPPLIARPTVGRTWKLAGAGTLLGAAALLGIFYQPVLAQWYANLGAVRMAQIELSGWNDLATNEFSQPDLGPAQTLLVRAVQLDARNPTAHYHLGLIALRASDFDAALTHLEIAYRADPAHRGVNKALGYTYVWLGRIDQAAPLLAGIPEARREMEVYAWWWTTQGRDDLAANAASIAARLDGGP